MATITNTRAQHVLETIEKLTNSRFLPIIGPIKGTELVKVAVEHSIKNVLEVGTLIGYSAILTASNLPPQGRVISIEKDPDSAKIAQKNIKKAGLEEKIHVITRDALEIIPSLNNGFDLIFLDGTKNEYLRYLKLPERLLEPGGVVFADNAKVFAAEMSDYLEYVRSSGKYRSRFIDFGNDGVEVSVLLYS